MKKNVQIWKTVLPFMRYEKIDITIFFLERCKIKKIYIISLLYLKIILSILP